VARSMSQVRFALDSPLEGDGFEPSVPHTKQPFSLPRSVPQFAFRDKNQLFRARDRWFESISLQRGVGCELDFGRDAEGGRYLSCLAAFRTGCERGSRHLKGRRRELVAPDAKFGRNQLVRDKLVNLTGR
jgi:hypothetical protein